MERRAADVIEAVTNSGLKYDESDEVVNVCQAIQEIRIESERKGERRGERRGEQKGEQRGELKKAREIAGKLYEMGLDPEKIAQTVGYSAETVTEWLGLS